MACSAGPASVPGPAAGAWRWLLPDLGLIAAFVALLYCFLLFDGVRKLFRDSDSGWHIRTGETILATGALPRTDPYSFTRAGQPWYAWEWGADALMGAAHRAAGLPGVALLYGVAIAAAVWLWFRLHWALGGNFFLACAMAAPMLTTTNLHWLARPHVFGWVLMLAGLILLETAPSRSRLGMLAGLGALWANVHASFLLLPAIAAIAYGLGHLLRPLIWDLDRAGEWRRARWFFLAALAAAVGSLANPYGWRLHAHIVKYLSDSELLARIGEFQSFNFHAEGAGQILLTVGLAGLGAVLALSQRRLGQFFLAAGLLALALRSARGLPLVALALLPVANGAIAEALAAARGLTPRLRRALDGFLNYSERMRTIDAGLNGAAAVPLVLLLALAWIRLPAVAARAGFPPDQFPVAASAEVAKLPAGARLLAPDKFGGYLIYRFSGARKVYFDGRSDFYGAAFMKDYIRLMQVRPGWQERVKDFTHALLPNDYSLLAALEGLGWKRLYRDGVVTLLERAGFSQSRQGAEAATRNSNVELVFKVRLSLWTARKLS